MKELINSIPEIISYIVYGYVFLATFYWVSLKDNRQDFKDLIIKSIVTNYILMTLYNIVINKYSIDFSNDYYKAACFLCISAAFGLLLGKVISHRIFNIILNKLHLGRTTNENIWDDVIRPNTWIRVFMKDGSSYLGLYKYGELFKSEPIIVLETYQKLDKDTDVVIDNSKNLNELIMLNTKDFDRIEITYN